MPAVCNDQITKPYQFSGRVIEGNKRGRQWGIPTANLDMANNTLPFTGVFCVEALLDKQIIKGVANLGNRPTVDGVKTVLEIHFFDFDETIYGKTLTVSFLHKLRDEAKFANIEALIAQIKQDIRDAKDYFDFDNRSKS